MTPPEKFTTESTLFSRRAGVAGVPSTPFLTASAALLGADKAIKAAIEAAVNPIKTPKQAPDNTAVTTTRAHLERTISETFLTIASNLEEVVTDCCGRG
jgi:hypothetical protein